MDAVRPRATLWGRLLLTVGLVIMAVGALAWIQGTETSGQEPIEKLTTVLADLARSVPQERGPAPAGRQEGPAISPDTLPRSIQDAIQTRRLRFTSGNAVQTYVLVKEVNEANLAALKAAGATIEIADAKQRRVQASIPASRLQAVAALPFVTFVRLPNYAVHRVGGSMSEGDAIVLSNAVRSDLGLDGTGIKVGVISDGLKGIFASGCTTCGGASGGPIASGDLPGATGTRNLLGVLTSSSGGITGRSFEADNDLEGLPSGSCGFEGAGAEGTALLEIVHDIAPGAQLAFANADTDLAFNQAVNYLASTNDIVLDDIGFYGAGEDGNSTISSNTAAALNNPENPVRAYVTSVGNAADQHYYGPYVDSGVDGDAFTGITNNGGLHLFRQGGDTTDVLGLGPQAYNVIQLPTNGEVVAFLTWDEPFGSAGNNYDLYLVQKGSGRVVARGTDVQRGSQDPVEFVDYTNRGSADQFYLVIQNVDDRAQAKNLNLFSFQPQCAQDGPRRLVPTRNERHNYNTPSRSVAAQGDAGGSPVSVISVAAICSASAASVAATSGLDESCLDRENRTVEYFSSRGPTLDGRLKPEIAAIDGVSVTGAGRFPSTFFGTSAASPHVGAIAALVLQAAPCLVAGSPGAVDHAAARTRLRDLLLQNATPLGDDAPNFDSGYGRANALASVQQALPVFRGAAAITVAGNNPLGASVSASDLGFFDPNQCPLTRLSWTGGCGSSPGATLECGFGSTSVSVAASSNGVAFSSASDVRITITNFGLAVSPGSATVAAGQGATYDISVAAQGGPYARTVTLGCSNLPAGASCSFIPATVSPGEGTVQARLTLTTTARAGAVVARTPAGIPGRGTPPPGVPRPVGPVLGGLALILFVAALGTCRQGRRPSRRTGGLAVCGGLALALLLATQAACDGPLINPPATTTTTTTVPPSGTSLSLSTSSLTFASQTVQTESAPQAVTLTNGGSAALTISTIAATGDFAQANTCGTTVAPGGSCSIGVTFRPTAPGNRTGTVTISSNASGSPHTVSLAGSGQSASGGTPAGSYSVNVTGASGTLVQAATATLVVQ